MHCGSPCLSRNLQSFHAGVALDHSIHSHCGFWLQDLNTTCMVVSPVEKVRLRVADHKSSDCNWLAARVTYGKTIESSTFQFSTPDFLYMLMFGAACMLVRYLFAIQGATSKHGFAATQGAANRLQA